MKKIQKSLSGLIALALVFQVQLARGESVEDRASNISPAHNPGAGEFVHGQGYGKILIRVLMFGAIPQQGVHYVPEGTDLVFALLYVGGYSTDAKLNGIKLRRKGVKDLIEIDLEDLLAAGGTIPKLMDGDVLHIPYSWRKDLQTIITVTGFVTSISGLAVAVATLLSLNRSAQ